MKTLKDILPKEFTYQVTGNDKVAIGDVKLDSREVVKGDVFAALSGTQTSGSKFIDQAIEKGAVAIISNQLPENINQSITYITCEHPGRLLSLLARNLYDDPTDEFELIGVTGTNGKTTTATLLYQLFTNMGFVCGLISTPGIYIAGKKLDATHTTPDTIKLNKTLSQMADASCEYVFMEVSSHAIAQERIYGLKYRGGIFTNLTHDHLDYHKTFQAYRDTKKAFFDSLPSEAFALTNIDDKNGRFMLQNTEASKYTFGLKNTADFKAKIIEHDMHGMLIDIERDEVYTTLSGEFNAYNILAAYATAVLLDVKKEELLTGISSLSPVEGRFAKVIGGGITGIVDYAHTPDALENILMAVREANLRGSKIISVVGCGGDRDKLKRPVMAKIAADLSDKLILTSDNPRSEDPEEILKEMQAGIPVYKRKDTLTIVDRKQAIKTACMLATNGDIVVVAGKGHEKYQEIKGVKYPFDDVEILQESLNQLN